MAKADRCASLPGEICRAGGLHLDEIAAGEPVAHAGGDGIAQHQPRAAVGMDMGRPPGRGVGHWTATRWNCTQDWRWRPEDALGRRLPQPICADRLFQAHKRQAGLKTVVKVIASSLRKGNVVDKDGKLYVILFAENIHPGKGTPVTQLDMRRISRRREGFGALPHHRAGGARLCRGARAHLPLPRRRRLPLHEPGNLRPGRGVAKRGRRPGALSAGRHGGAAVAASTALPFRWCCRSARPSKWWKPSR